MKNEGFYNYSADSIDGQSIKMSAFKGKAVLVVNVASQCGFTPQYTGLEKLYLKYKSEGFEVLGFPCNQFGAQEPGDEQEIKNFCSLKYNVTFPMFHKIDVNGPNTHPLYEYLKSEGKGILGTSAIKWNFTKFLVDRNGNVLRRYPPTATPESLEDDIKEALAQK